MPMNSEHSARINEPTKYSKFRRENNKFGQGIDVIWGILPSGKTEVQAIRFDKTKFTPDAARKWLKEHKYKTIEFEPAKSGPVEEKQSIDTPMAPSIVSRRLVADAFSSKLKELSDEQGGRKLVGQSTLATSDARVPRMFFDPESGRLGHFNEVLPINERSVLLGRSQKQGGLPWNFDHNPVSVLGTHENVRCEGKRLIADSNFPLRDGSVYSGVGEKFDIDQIYADIRDGRMPCLSARYRNNGEATIIRKGSSLNGIDAADRDVWMWNVWEPLEGSSVTIPADPDSGFRSLAELDSQEYERGWNESDLIPFRFEIIAPKKAMIINRTFEEETPVTIEELIEAMKALKPDERRSVISAVDPKADEFTATSEVRKLSETNAAAVEKARADGLVEGKKYHEEFVEVARSVAENAEKWATDPLAQNLFKHYGKKLEIVKEIADEMRRQRTAPAGGKPRTDGESAPTLKVESYTAEQWARAFGG